MAEGSWRHCEALKYMEGQLLCSRRKRHLSSPWCPQHMIVPPSCLPRKRSLNPNDHTVCGWLILIPSQGALGHTTVSKLSTLILSWEDTETNRTSFQYGCDVGLPFSARESTLWMGPKIQIKSHFSQSKAYSGRHSNNLRASFKARYRPVLCKCINSCACTVGPACPTALVCLYPVLLQ